MYVLPHLCFVFVFFRISTGLLVFLYFDADFVLLRDELLVLLRPVKTMLKMHLWTSWRSLLTTLGQQSPRGFLRCRCIFEKSFTVTHNSSSLTYTVASSLVCTSPLAVITVTRVLEKLALYPILMSFKSFWLSMCIDPPESTTNSVPSGFVKDGEGIHRI